MTNETMSVKVIKIHRLEGAESRLKGFADIAVNEAILIKGVRIIQGKKQLYITMPSEQGKNERWYERVRCLNQDIRELISRKVLESYDAPAPSLIDSSSAH